MKSAALAIVVLIAGCDRDTTDPPGNEPGVVYMLPNSFVPFTTTIPVGGVVTFAFPSDEHNVIFERIAGAPADIQATKNTRVSRSFMMVGTFPFDCTLHPGMSGEVVVK